MDAPTNFLGRVLLVDDDASVRGMLTTALESAGFAVKPVGNLGELRSAVKQRFYDVILLDLFLDGEEGFEILPFLVRDFPYTKVFVMSAHGTIELAVNAMESGASTFLSKSRNPNDIVSELIARLEVANSGKSRVEDPAAYKNRYGIVGTSPEIVNVIKRIELVKDVDSTVLITGESGTGKELVARAIHNSSVRSAFRFEAINCGAIPGNLLESELFGHKRGTFTDAKTDRVGILEICGDGTLLLDEVGELPLELQVKLLRVLQEEEFTPLGSHKSQKLKARIIAATNRNLEEEVRNGKFREDLYFRLAVLTIDLPPLREHRGDIPLLINHLITKFSDKFSKPMASPSKELEARLTAYDWPGNIRELQNAIERGVVLSNDGELHIEDMLTAAKQSYTARDLNIETVMSSDFVSKTLSEAKLDFEKEYLRQLLEITHGNISEIARISGRYRADVYRLLAKHEVHWEEFRKQPDLC